ncbi:MAG: DUF357 domain-containing protein [Candidatus Pacearchaeota archaeon]
MKSKITKQQVEKYYKITFKALEEIKKNVSKGRKKEAEEIIKMVEAYLSDSKFFEKKGDLINSFGAIYYAHGWIDCGVRLGIFNVKDDKLFTIK